MQIKECVFPQQSRVANEAVSADFHDSFKLSSIEEVLDPLDIYLLMVNNTPTWINLLLSLRNKIVKKLGLNDVGKLGGIKRFDDHNNKHLVGTKLDIFIIESLNQNEMILTQRDKHLDIKLSILKYENIGQTDVIVSTIVNFHNYFGRIYMIIIRPFHKIIVKRLLKNILSKKVPIK